MRKVMQQVGFKGSLQDFFKHVNTDPQFKFASEEALLAHYRGIARRWNRPEPHVR
jgi:uncharacterized protein (DUF885 family)